MGYFIIKYGLGGGFGGADNYEVVKVDNLEEAEKWAWESACESYESYAGLYGLRTVEEIMEEEEIDEEEAGYAYEEERESWLDYSATPFSKEVEEKAERNHYHNPYKEVTSKL